MTSSNSFFTSVIRHPFSFAVIVLSAVILFIWFDYKSTLQPATGNSSRNEATVAGSTAARSVDQPIALSPPTTANSGRTQPKIMDQFGAGANQGQSGGAPAIDALVGRLEDKVKSDPKNMGNRILLAQTYKELGRVTDAVEILQGIKKEDPDNSRANLVLASILSQSDDPKELQESLQLLESVNSDVTIQPYLIHMYRGDAMIRQNNHEGALANWKQALASMPETDARYTIIEKKVMELTSGASSTSSEGS